MARAPAIERSQQVAERDHGGQKNRQPARERIQIANRFLRCRALDRDLVTEGERAPLLARRAGRVAHEQAIAVLGRQRILPAALADVAVAQLRGEPGALRGELRSPLEEGGGAGRIALRGVHRGERPGQRQRRFEQRQQVAARGKEGGVPDVGDDGHDLLDAEAGDAVHDRWTAKRRCRRLALRAADLVVERLVPLRQSVNLGLSRARFTGPHKALDQPGAVSVERGHALHVDGERPIRRRRPHRFVYQAVQVAGMIDSPGSGGCKLDPVRCRAGG